MNSVNEYSFYQARHQYKTMVCDSMFNEVTRDDSYSDYEKAMNVEYKHAVILSHSLVTNMRQVFAQCQQMMKVSDKELKAYREKREQMDIDMDKNEERLMWINKVNKLQEDINNAKGGK